MCGIVGLYSPEQPVDRAKLAASLNSLAHRGPDQAGLYLSPRRVCGLGVRRLSIIDVAGGDQPLRTADESLHLVYNGETYNHAALRRELARLGHHPRTGNDGEVILYGYRAWGAKAMLQKLRGMAAFALWDEPAQTLLLGRDRFGIKPLYYAEQAGRLYFASEIKALLPYLPRRVNRAALEAMLTVGFVPGPATMFEGIYKLPPAHFLLAHNGTIRLEPYWRLTYPEPETIPTEAEAAEEFLALLREAVQLRLMSEVPLGALLSGGLDSGTLVALAQAGLNRRLKTISIGFDHPAYDETEQATALAGFIGTDHHPATFGPADFDTYPALMDHLEEPQCSATAVPIHRLYRTCRRTGLTVVLTGEGADELLGGYHWHRGDALARPLLDWPESMRHLLAASPLPISAAARRVLHRGHMDAARRYRDWLEIEGADYRRRLLTHSPPENPLLDWGDQSGSTVPLHQFQWLESRSRLVDFINMEVDKMSMACSIEARVPFLDHRLWEFCAALPAAYKLKGRTEKHLLREAVRGLLPEATRLRSKKGLAAPYADWLGAARWPDWAEALFSEGAIRRAGLFRPGPAHRLRQAHRSGQPGLAPLLMGVLSAQLWWERFIR